MSQTSTMTKMFGALVLGSGVILAGNSQAEPPKKKEEPISKEAKPVESKERAPATEEKDFCQLEFTHIQYSREGETPTKTCLDEKTDKEILEIINEAKKNTCMSPFCGCWLG